MVRTFSLKLLRLFSRPENRHELPCSRHPYYPGRPSPSARVSKEVVWCVFCCPSFLSIVLATCSSTINHPRRRLVIIAHARSCGPTTLVYESNAYTSTTNSTNAVHGKAHYASTCAYLASHACRHWLTIYSALLSLCPPLVDASDDALQSPIHHRHHYALPVAAVCCPGYVNLGAPDHHRCLLSVPPYYYYIPRRDEANRRARQVRAQRQQLATQQ